MTEERVLGIITDAQAKPQGHFTVKNCDLVFTNRQIIVANAGSSTFVGAMAGLAVAGAAGAMAAGVSANRAVDKGRAAREGFSPDEILAADRSNLSIPIDSIQRVTLGTGFFSTLWLFAPLKIWYGEKTFFCNLPYSRLDSSRRLIESALSMVEIY